MSDLRPFRTVLGSKSEPAPPEFTVYSAIACTSLAEILEVKEREEQKLDERHRAELAQMLCTVAAHSHLMTQVEAARRR